MTDAASSVSIHARIRLDASSAIRSSTPAGEVNEHVTEHRQTVNAPGAPAAIGPYNHAVRAGGLLFCSGQIPLDPDSGEIVGATAAEQTRQCLRNLDAIARAGGASLADAVRIGVFLVDMGSFAEVNEAYAEFFADDDAPARYAFGVASLPRGALVGFEAVVAVP
jgi:2-iminobutanoate/2-iminopropanoate deaminase